MAGDGALGQVTVTPATGMAGEWGTWVVSYRVGTPGLAAGAAVRVQLPETWHVWYRNSSHGTFIFSFGSAAPATDCNNESKSSERKMRFMPDTSVPNRLSATFSRPAP